MFSIMSLSKSTKQRHQESGDFEGKQRGTAIVAERGAWGSCGCGGRIVYYTDFGVRCEKCSKLYGTWVENLRKAKEEENQRKEHIARLIEIRKFDEEMVI